MTEIRRKDGRKQLGAWGERIAADHLQAKGYQILRRNWRCARGEIDLVAQAGAELVFVEVKTRRGRAMGTPEEGLTPHTARKLLQLAQYYFYENDLDADEVDWRIDLVAVELDAHGKFLRCDHIPNLTLGW